KRVGQLPTGGTRSRCPFAGSTDSGGNGSKMLTRASQIHPAAMAHIVIIGDRDSGKTTFLALLYAAQVKSGATRADDFRFHVDLASMEEISEVFQQLMSGSFPDSAAKEGISDINCHVGHRRSSSGVMARRSSKACSP